VFDFRLPTGVVGVATENFESTTYLDAIEETTQAGDTTTQVYQRVLSYGVAVNGAHLAPWIDDHLPEFDHAAREARLQARLQ
jgi:hypothetical protein